MRTAFKAIDVVVCIRASDPSPFTDNLRGVCMECGGTVQFRPYVPVSLPKLCIACAPAVLEREKGTKH
jgi:hypothetical protein